MVSKFNIYNVHLKWFDSIRYLLNQYTTLTKNFNRTRTNIHTYIHTDTVKAICPHGDYRPQRHKTVITVGYYDIIISQITSGPPYVGELEQYRGQYIHSNQPGQPVS